MGYPLPQWQRPLVWTDDQKAKFITSLWMEIDVGSYLVNDVFECLKIKGQTIDVYREFSDILLDGQQRLSSLKDYLLGKFSVPDASGIETCWTDLSKVERRQFCNQTFSRAIVNS